MKKYYPEGDINDPQNEIGISIAQTAIQILKQCGNDLTRDNIIKQAASLKNLELPLLLPGIKLNTGSRPILSDHPAAADQVRRQELGAVRRHHQRLVIPHIRGAAGRRPAGRGLVTGSQGRVRRPRTRPPFRHSTEDLRGGFFE